MKKRLGMAMVLALGLVLLTAGMAGAAKYHDLTGTWSGDLASAYWDKAIHYGFSVYPRTMEVTHQDENGVFYGTFFSMPLTGSIATNKVITATCYFSGGIGYTVIINGRLTGKKIRGSFNGFTVDGGFIETGKFELIKEESAP